MLLWTRRRCLKRRLLHGSPRASLPRLRGDRRLRPPSRIDRARRRVDGSPDGPEPEDAGGHREGRRGRGSGTRGPAGACRTGQRAPPGREEEDPREQAPATTTARAQLVQPTRRGTLPMRRDERATGAQPADPTGALLRARCPAQRHRRCGVGRRAWNPAGPG